mgnify:CR=1 FL=1
MLFSGVVLNGGTSSRMGEPKGELNFLGKPLMEVPLSALSKSGASEIIVIGGDRPDWLPSEIFHVDDPYPGEGPLGGVISALRICNEESVMILSNDLMGIDSETILTILKKVNSQGVVVPVAGSKRQVLSALWRRSLLASLTEIYETGERSIQTALKSLSVTEVNEFDQDKFANANTPSDIIDYIATTGDTYE